MHMITPVFELRDGMGCTPVSEGGNFTMADPREAVYAASVRRRASTVALHRFAVAKQFMVKKKKTNQVVAAGNNNLIDTINTKKDCYI